MSRSPFSAVAVALAFLSSPAGARPAAGADAQALLRAADAPRHVVDEGLLKIRATMRKKQEPPAVSDLVVRVKGIDRMRCTFVEGTQKGREVLAVGDKTWLLVPGASRAIPISASQRLLGGASLAEIGRLRLASEYTASIRETKEAVDGASCLVLDLRSKSARAQYPTGVLWIDEEKELPRRLRLALPSGKDAKEIRFTGFGRESGKTVVRSMEVRHLLFSERGIVTSLEFLSYEASPLPDGTFEPPKAR
jgi:hypothetical protein